VLALTSSLKALPILPSSAPGDGGVAQLAGDSRNVKMSQENPIDFNTVGRIT